MMNLFFGLALDPKHTTVMQSVFVDHVTREVFVSQAKSGTVGSRETTVVSRHTPSGVFIDSMEFIDAGHGTCVFSETDPMTMETRVWLNVIKYDNATVGSPYVHQLVRVPWSAGAAYNGSSPEVTSNVVNTFANGAYTLANPDFSTDTVLMRETVGSTEVQYLRKFSELVAGIDNTISASIITSTSTDVVQGFATDGTTRFLRYLGSSTPGTGKVQVYSWSMGSLIEEVPVESLRYEADGSQEGGFSEPEGMSVFSAGGEFFVVVGMSGGVSGRRTHRFGVLTDSNGHPWLSDQAKVERHRAVMMPDRRAFQPAPSITVLSDIIRPGSHYLTTSQFAAMVDRPPSAAPGAYMLHVSPRNNANTAVIQRLTLFSLANSGEWYRVIDFSAGQSSPWFATIPTGNGVTPNRQSYTPSLTNVNLGSGGTVSGDYIEHEGTVDAEVVIVLGAGGGSSGTMKVGLPVPGRTSHLVPGAQELAWGTFWDASTGGFYPAIGVPPNTSGTEVQLRYVNSSGSRVTGSPFPLAAGDKIVLTLRYTSA